MRIVILGPVVNATLSGGVGVFDEGLYRGFQGIGDVVEVISLAKSSSIDNAVIGNGNYSTRKIWASFHKIGKEIKRF